jgi:type IV pilus assembly protein PilA
MITKAMNRSKSEEGFTLIELLVVILIIGILAAIAIPSFLNQRTKGQDACAKSMARTMQTAMETLYVDNNSYASATPTVLNGYENQITNAPCGSGTTINVGGSGSNTAGGNGCTGSVAANNYCVGVTSASGNGFSISRSTTGTITRTCALATGQSAPYGGCTNSSPGTW